MAGAASARRHGGGRLTGRASFVTLLVLLATLAEMALSAPVQEPGFEALARVKRQFGGMRQQGGHNRQGGHHGNRPGGQQGHRPGGHHGNRPGGHPGGSGGFINQPGGGGGGGGFMNRPGGGALINKPGPVGNLQSSAGIAGAQTFQNQGPLGSFGASATNAGTQGVNFRPGGFSGTAGQSISQNYQLPGGGSASISITDGVSVDSQGGTSNSHGSSIAITPPKTPKGPAGFFGGW